MKSNGADFDDEEVVALSVDLQNAKLVQRNFEKRQQVCKHEQIIIETGAKKK